MIRSYVVILVLLLFSFAIADEAEDVLEKVQDRYEQIEFLKIEFEQVNKFRLSGIENHSSGIMYIARDDRFRLESDQQTIITDGNKIWSYSPINKQLIIDLTKMDKHTIMPRELLFSYGNRYYANLIKSYKEKGDLWYLIKLTPKPDYKSAINSTKIWVNSKNWMVYKIEYLDMNDNTTTYIVNKVEMPKKINPEIFQFKAPENTKIIDLTNRHG